MNIIKTTGIGIIIIMLCTLCTEYPKSYDPVQAFPDTRFLSVKADVAATAVPVKINEGYDIEWFGNTTSCNMSPSAAPCITVSGMITQAHKMGGFSLESGELWLESTTTNCKLWGQFNGKGTLTGNSFVINSDVELTYGTGSFECSGGTLNMTISGLLPTDDNPDQIYALTLNGQLEK